VTNPGSAVKAPLSSRGGLVSGLRVALASLGLFVLAAGLSACGASNALGSAVLAPLSVLPATDVVFETNLQSAREVATSDVGVSGISGLGNNGGGFTTDGAPSSPGLVSIASTTGLSVYSAFNPADRHCLGSFVIAPGATVTVLGQSSPGTYDFWFGPTTANDCTASIFTTETTVPSRWVSGDPSASGWPGP